jgi:hypothetical protein
VLTLFESWLKKLDYNKAKIRKICLLKLLRDANAVASNLSQMQKTEDFVAGSVQIGL